MFNRFDMSDLALLEPMRRASVLRHLPLGELDLLLSRSRTRSLTGGQTLLEEGEPGTRIYLVLDGSVVIQRRVGEAESTVLAVRRTGEWIGELSLIDEGPRTATVRADGATRLLEVEREIFLRAVGAHPAAALDLMRTVTARLREADGQRIEALGEKARNLAASNRKLRHENRRLRSEVDDPTGLERFRGRSPTARAVRAAARQAAASDLPVLLIGETGTGKEILARAIHSASDRSHHRFVAINCALCSAPLLESQLFGHSRGAFTGATHSHVGLVQEADRGTLFLDEVTDMPRDLQGALLRFLELGEFRPVGDSRTRRSSARIVAAAQEGLERAVEEGRFRRDLYYRLEVLRIPIPPLRERREDIPELAVELMDAAARRAGSAPLRFDADALDALSAYDFPGNVRELENELLRLAVGHADGGELSRRDLSARVRGDGMGLATHYTDAVRRFKQQLIASALQAAQGNRSEAARALGLHRSNLVRMIRELGLDPTPPPDRGSPEPAGGGSGASVRVGRG